MEDIAFGRRCTSPGREQRILAAGAGEGRPRGQTIRLPFIGDTAGRQVAIAALEAVVLDRDDAHGNRRLAAGSIVVRDPADGVVNSAMLEDMRERGRAAGRRRCIDLPHDGRLLAAAVAWIPCRCVRVAPSGVFEMGAKQER